MDAYSATALVFSIMYGILAVRNNRLCFMAGFIASIIWAFADIYKYNLKFDGLLQMFYALMSIWGYTQWNSKSTENITKMSLKYHLLIIPIGVLISIILANELQSLLQTALPLLDAHTTIFSIMATVMMVYRKIENWIYLFICNTVYIYIYYQQGAYIFSVMMIVFSIIAVMGYLSWQKKAATLSQ